MPHYGGHPNFHGKKGRSGRLDFEREREIGEILDLSAKSIKAFLKSDKFPVDSKAKLGAELLKRKIGDKKEIDAVVLTEQEQELINSFVRPVLN